MPKTSYVPSEKMLRCLYITLNKFRDELKKSVFHLKVKAALTIIITVLSVCMVEMSFFMRALDSVSATVFSSAMALTGIYIFYDLCMSFPLVIIIAFFIISFKYDSFND